MEQERAGVNSSGYIQEFNIGKISQNRQVLIKLENLLQSHTSKQDINILTQSYTTTCDISRIDGKLLAKGRIYQAKLGQKQLILSLYEVSNDKFNAVVLKSEKIFESKVSFANQGVWFTMLNDVLSLIAVDVLGNIFVISLRDEQTIRQYNIQGIDILWSVSAIEYYEQSKENICFLACGNDGQLFYFNQPLLENNSEIYPQHQGSLKGIFGRLSSANFKFDSLHFCAQITDFVYILIHDGLKIVTINDSMTITKANNLGGQSIIPKERENYKFYQSGFSCDQINNGATQRGSLLVWNNVRLRIINVDFVKRNGQRQVSNLEEGGVFSFNDVLYFQVQEISEIPAINNIVKLNDQVVISRRGYSNLALSCSQAGISTLIVTECHKPNCGAELLHQTNYGIIFADYEMELFTLVLIENPVMNMVVSFQLITENVLQQIKNIQEPSYQDDLVFCIQRVKSDQMNVIFKSLQSYNFDFKEQLLLANIMVQNQEFQNGVVRCLKKNNSIQSFKELFNDLVDRNQYILVYLLQNSKINRVQIQESLENAFQEIETLLSGDNQNVSYDAQRLGNYSQVFIGFEANCRLIIDSAINLLISHLVLLVEYDIDFTFYENQLRRLISIKTFLNEKDALIQLIKNTRSQIQKFNINYFEITNQEYENLCLNSVRILHKDFDGCPFLIDYMNMIAPNYTCTAGIAETLKNQNPNLIYHQAIAYSKLNRQNDCKMTIFRLAKIVNQMESVEFDQGTWAEDKQGSRSVIRRGNNFSNEQELIKILLKGNEIEEITQVIIGLSYFTPDAESEFSKGIFPYLFKAALKSNLIDLSVELLLISSRLLAHSRPKYRLIVESFIDQFCNQQSINNLINLPLDMRVVHEIYPYIQKWNRRFFDNLNNLYEVLVREKGCLAQRCATLIQQNNFLYKRNLFGYANEVLKSYLDFLDDLLFKDSDSQVLYEQIIAEKLNVLALIIQQMNQHKVDSPFYGLFVGYLNIGQHENDILEFRNPVDLAEEIIQNYRITYVMNGILQIYNIKIKDKDDIELVLLAQRNYPLLLEYWKTGQALKFTEGIQMLVEDSYDDKTTCKLLKALLTAPEFQQQHQEIIETIVGSLCLTDRLDLLTDLKLGPEIFKFANLALQFNKEVDSDYLNQELNNLINLRNVRQFNDQMDPVYVNERSLANISLKDKRIRETLKNPEFLTENL